MTTDQYLSALRRAGATAEGANGTDPAPLCLLAPLSGVTDLHMRRIARRCGADAVVSEMVAARELARGSGEAAMRAEGSGVDLHVSSSRAARRARWRRPPGSRRPGAPT